VLWKGAGYDRSSFLVKVGWRQDRALESGLLEDYAAGGRKRALGLNVLFVDQHCDENLIMLRGLGLGLNSEVKFQGGLHEKHAVQRVFWALSQHLL